jgi:SulP family sulfate permease
MLALWETKKAGLFQLKHRLSNIVAGAIFGIVALPLTIAFAIASGAKPEQGIYSNSSGIYCSIFWVSRLQVALPTSASIVVLSAITSKYGIEGLQIASLIAEVILLFLDLAK